MFGRDEVSCGFLSLRLFMPLLTLAVNVTPVSGPGGIAHQPTMAVLRPETRGMSVVALPHDSMVGDRDTDFATAASDEGRPDDGSPESPW